MLLEICWRPLFYLCTRSSICPAIAGSLCYQGGTSKSANRARWFESAGACLRLSSYTAAIWGYQSNRYLLNIVHCSCIQNLHQCRSSVSVFACASETIVIEALWDICNLSQQTWGCVVIVTIRSYIVYEILLPATLVCIQLDRQSSGVYNWYDRLVIRDFWELQYLNLNFTRTVMMASLWKTNGDVLLPGPDIALRRWTIDPKSA